MITLGFVLIHNKATAAANRAQITFLASSIVSDSTKDDHFFYYKISGLAAEHRAYFFQIIPAGVSRPSNMGSVDSFNLLLGPDQPSHNRRYFNWSVKRGVELGCDAITIITDHTVMTMADWRSAMQDLTGPKIFIERAWGYVIEPRVFKIIGRLREDLTFAQAMAELKQRITGGGYTHG